MNSAPAAHIHEVKNPVAEDPALREHRIVVLEPLRLEPANSKLEILNSRQYRRTESKMTQTPFGAN